LRQPGQAGRESSVDDRWVDDRQHLRYDASDDFLIGHSSAAPPSPVSRVMASTKTVRAAIFFGLVIALFTPAMHALFAQGSPAQALWSGQAQCVVVAKSADYQDEQTHTWTLTGAAPTPPPPGTAQVYYTWPATWVVRGGGLKTIPTARDSQERWTIASEMNATLRFTEIAGQPVRLRIGADGQRGAPLGSIRVTEVSGRTRDASVQPWPFPAIEDNATNTTISGTSTRTFPEGFGVGWGQPPKVITTATCMWSFTRGGEQTEAGRERTSRGPLAGVSTSAVVNSGPASSNGPAAASIGGTLPASPPNRQGVEGTAVPLAGASGVGGTGASSRAIPAARRIDLAGFTAQGAPGSLRTIALGGFTATGAPPPAALRTIALTGWTATGVGP
jgi:hypothetical protein